MKVQFKTFVIGIIGTAAFENGLHNVFSRPELGLGMSWVLVAMGAGALLVATLDVLAAHRAIRRPPQS